MPTLQQSLPFDLTTFGLVLFALTAVCFALTGIVNPGVPPEPPPQQAARRSSRRALASARSRTD